MRENEGRNQGELNCFTLYSKLSSPQIIFFIKKNIKRCYSLIESKIILYDIKDLLHEIFKENSEKDLNVKRELITVIKEDFYSKVIEKKRALKRWKETLNYYYVDPYKFKT